VNTTDDFIELLSRDFQVIANVSESDIAKVNLGDPVSMTLDAFYYDKVFEAEIVEIDPAETVVQGVIYYQITAGFTTEDTQVKPGMTANMDIVTEETTNVLAVPIRAVKYDGARSYVLQPDSIVSGTTKEVDIEVGLRGDQFIEVVSGLEEGDDVVTYVR
jgi:multidrug efflux pump subunit AcrA (membrane-fusion protein)